MPIRRTPMTGPDEPPPALSSCNQSPVYALAGDWWIWLDWCTVRPPSFGKGHQLLEIIEMHQDSKHIMANDGQL